MAADNPTQTAAFDVPLGELVRSLAMAVAEAQSAMDRTSLIQAEMMSGQSVLRDWKTGNLVDADGKPSTDPVLLDSRVYFGHDVEDGKRVPVKLSMLELGFAPTFYQFVETTIEVRIAVRVSRTEAADGDARYKLSGTTVDAGYAAAYNYDLNAAALFKTKVVPVPPPAVLDQRIQRLLEREKQRTRAETAQAGVGTTSSAETKPPSEAGTSAGGTKGKARS